MEQQCQYDRCSSPADKFISFVGEWLCPKHEEQYNNRKLLIHTAEHQELKRKSLNPFTIGSTPNQIKRFRKSPFKNPELQPTPPATEVVLLNAGSPSRPLANQDLSPKVFIEGEYFKQRQSSPVHYPQTLLHGKRADIDKPPTNSSRDPFDSERMGWESPNDFVNKATSRDLCIADQQTEIKDLGCTLSKLREENQHMRRSIVRLQEVLAEWKSSIEKFVA